MYGTYYDITKENILQRTSQLEIFSFYIPHFKPNTTILSPFGEKHPSFWTKVNANGKIYFQDFSRQNFRGDCFDFVKMYFGINFQEALEKINYDLKLGLGIASNELDQTHHLDLISRVKPQAPVFNEIFLDYDLRPWNNLDSWYWLRSGCDLKLVREAGINTASKFYINGKTFYTHQFAYLWHTHGPHMKFYQPFVNKKYKWRSTTNNDWLQNENRLPEKGKQLILQSSLKDSLCVETLTGVIGIPPNSENSAFPKNKLDDYEKRFDEIFILYDNDDTGNNSADTLHSERKYKIIRLPKMSEDHVKDPSAFCYYGYKKELIKTLRHNGLKLEFRTR